MQEILTYCCRAFVSAVTMQARESSTCVVGVNVVGLASAPCNSDTATVKYARVGKVCLCAASCSAPSACFNGLLEFTVVANFC